MNSDSNLGTGALTFNGGTLEALVSGGGVTSAKVITLSAGGGTFLADAGTASTWSGVISGMGGFTKSGGGELVLSANNPYSGPTIVSAGILVLSGIGANAGGITINPEATIFVGSGGTKGGFSGFAVDNGTVVFDRSDTVVFSGILPGSGNLVQAGSGLGN